MLDENDFYAEAFSRNRGLLSLKQQERLRHTTVVIPGLGGVGAIYATTFARLGVGHFRIADMDSYEVVNMNRQDAATMETVGVPKVEAVKNRILSINPYATVEVFPEGLQEGNSDAFFRGADIVLDAVDFFCIDVRRRIYRGARKENIFVISAGPIGFGSSVLVFDPQGMSFEDYFDIHDGQTEEEMLLRFGLGVTPTLLQRRYFKPESVNWKEKKTPSLVTGTLLCANLVSTEALKILFRGRVRAVPHSLHFDPFLRTLKKVYIPFGNRNPMQRLKLFLVKRVLRSQGRLSA